MTTVHVNRLHNFTGHHAGIYSLQRSDQSHLFFSGAADGMVVLWNLHQPDEGELIASLPNTVFAIHYHKPTQLLVVGHNYNGIHLLDWHARKEIGSLKMTSVQIFDIQSYGHHLFVGDKEGTVTVINVHDLSIVHTLKASDKSVRTIAINEVTGELAVGYSDHYIRVFNANTLQMSQAWVAHLNSVFTLRYTSDGSYLLSGSRDARLKLWDVKGGYALVSEVVAHMNTINHVEFSPDSKHFVTCSMDKSIKVWDLDEMRLLKVIDKSRHEGHGTSVNRLLWTDYKAQLVSASDDRTISVWDIDIEQGRPI
jgi:WD40 repeat protein